MNSEEDVIKKKVWSTKDVVTIAALCISITFSITLIWGRFLFMETKVNEVDVKVDYVDQRHDRKYERLLEIIAEVEEDVDKLKQPNSDNE